MSESKSLYEIVRDWLSQFLKKWWSVKPKEAPSKTTEEIHKEVTIEKEPELLAKQEKMTMERERFAETGTLVPPPEPTSQPEDSGLVPETIAEKEAKVGRGYMEGTNEEIVVRAPCGANGILMRAHIDENGNVQGYSMIDAVYGGTPEDACVSEFGRTHRTKESLTPYMV